MKKHIVFVILTQLFNVIALFGQPNTLSLDSCGIDDNILLNKYESRFLNICESAKICAPITMNRKNNNIYFAWAAKISKYIISRLSW